MLRKIIVSPGTPSTSASTFDVSFNRIQAGPDNLRPLHDSGITSPDPWDHQPKIILPLACKGEEPIRSRPALNGDADGVRHFFVDSTAMRLVEHLIGHGTEPFILHATQPKGWESLLTSKGRRTVLGYWGTSGFGNHDGIAQSIDHPF